MATELKPFIYVIGIGGSSFSVTIQSSKTVDDLKDAIKEKKKPRLDHIDADELTLYKVSIPDDDETLEQEACLAIRKGPKLKVSSRQLFKVFQEPLPAETVSVVVTLPEGFDSGACLRDLDIFSSSSSHSSCYLLPSYSIDPPLWHYPTHFHSIAFLTHNYRDWSHSFNHTH